MAVLKPARRGHPRGHGSRGLSATPLGGRGGSVGERYWPESVGFNRIRPARMSQGFADGSKVDPPFIICDRAAELDGFA
jgi:hypothetical protein